MENAEKKLQENLPSTVAVKAACELTGKHTLNYSSAEAGQCLFVCTDCSHVFTEFEDSQP